jgi:hypothetical protein
MAKEMAKFRTHLAQRLFSAVRWQTLHGGLQGLSNEAA